MAYQQVSTDVNTKSKKIMNAVAKYASYYRENPHRFIEEYLGINLKLFQKIIINMFNDCDYAAFIACRGLGKLGEKNKCKNTNMMKIIFI